ncbi:flagellar hook protein FlgE [Pseudoxanthomonas winnipegensis]|uniref:Flagellar hook protein FlgE n=1 Tax=Pseudoxanthomonas winnipegensis TaxID=2480810 RepID=A0A4Q8LPR8_9GAMM|nr:flagellar hook protein FlgE [Pseudoxanthomonas winnipegensis]RZZ89296.1 flagellar hook protein FlgE [Pseudoxanthomonas winnipegensis]TAA33259.1 flagellar hook protein FlgE [Pseudoxanthomonas winnipegensis]TBV72778.1 flagellar hook protein FlgE [Pseudoxanthomonas winnipegensis]
MSFRISLSGMNAASSDLNVVSNNIANSNTTGFKSSRAEFGDVFAASVYGVSSNATGAGARLQRVAQQFTQGNIDFTGNSLDMAVSGQGFFTLSDNGTTVYSRAGNFSTDASGYVVNPSGQRLQVFAPNDDGTTFNTGKLSDLQLVTGDAPPKVSTKVQANVTLPGNATAPTNSPFDAADPTTYSQTTSLTVYDSLGAAHTQSLYFSKTANANEWTVQTQIDGVSVGGAQTLTYDSSGALVSPANGQLALPAYTPPGGAGAMALSLDLSKSAQYGQKFAVSALNQDGYGTGSLSGISVSSEGVVQASYSNGVTKAIGQVALSSFASPQGLQQKGDNAFAETFASGQAVRGAAGTSDFGLVQGGALEASNVDQTAELVNMISAQRNFQANAQMIQTQDQITQTIINLR